MSVANPLVPAPLIRQLGLVDYDQTRQRMVDFTEQRDADAADELWILQHPSIFTLGRAADESHVLNTGNIQVLRVERGGQVTYHGPGQLVIYPLINIDRLGISARALVTIIEQSIVEVLADHGINSEADPAAPGVYATKNGQRAKIASLGLRIRRGCSFHGLSLNVDMDLAPYQLINPCGYAGLVMAQVSDFVEKPSVEKLGEQISQRLIRKLDLVDSPICVKQAS